MFGKATLTLTLTLRNKFFKLENALVEICVRTGTCAGMEGLIFHPLCWLAGFEAVYALTDWTPAAKENASNSLILLKFLCGGWWAVLLWILILWTTMKVWRSSNTKRYAFMRKFLAGNDWGWKVSFGRSACLLSVCPNVPNAGLGRDGARLAGI